jgi:hypothetical protein
MVTGRLLDRTRTRCALGALALVVIAAGCAGGPAASTVLHKGELGPGRYLATLVVRENGCWPHGTACAVQDAERGIMFLPTDPFTPPEVYERFARELCRTVAEVRGVADAERLCADGAPGRVSLR